MTGINRLKSSRDFLNAFEELYQRSPIPQLHNSMQAVRHQSPAPIAIAGQHTNIKAIFDQMKLRGSTSLSMSSDLNTTSMTTTDASSGETARQVLDLQDEAEELQTAKDKRNISSETNGPRPLQEASYSAKHSLSPCPPALQVQRNLRHRTGQTPAEQVEKTLLRRSPRKISVQRTVDCGSSSGSDDDTLLKTKRFHQEHVPKMNEMKLVNGSQILEHPAVRVEIFRPRNNKHVHIKNNKRLCNNSSSGDHKNGGEASSLTNRLGALESCRPQGLVHNSSRNSVQHGPQSQQEALFCDKSPSKIQRSTRQTEKTQKVRGDICPQPLSQPCSQEEPLVNSFVNSLSSPDLPTASLVKTSSFSSPDANKADKKADEETLQLVSKLVQRLRSTSDSDLDDTFDEGPGWMKTFPSKTKSKSPITSTQVVRKVNHSLSGRTANIEEQETQNQTAGQEVRKVSHPSSEKIANKEQNQTADTGQKAESRKRRETGCLKTDTGDSRIYTENTSTGQSSQMPETRSKLKKDMLAKEANTLKGGRGSLQSNPKTESRKLQIVGKMQWSLRPRQGSIAAADVQAKSKHSQCQKNISSLDLEKPKKEDNVEDDAIFAFKKLDNKKGKFERTAQTASEKRNNTKSIQLGKEKNSQSDILILRSWSLQPVPKLGGVRVEGKLQNVDYYWCTSLISKRISGRTLQSANGSTYCLLGAQAKNSTLTAGFSKDVADAFRYGFPKNWKKLIQADLEKMSTSETETKTNKRAKEDLTNFNVSTNCDSAGPVTAYKQMFTPKSTKEDVSEQTAIWTPSGVISRELGASEVRRTRSGRCVIPPLARWAGQYSERDADGNVTIGFSSLAAEKHFAKIAEMCVNARKGHSNLASSQKAISVDVKEKMTRTAPKRTSRHHGLHSSSSSPGSDTSEEAVPAVSVKDTFDKRKNKQQRDCVITNSSNSSLKQRIDCVDRLTLPVDTESAGESEADVDNMESDLLALVKKSSDMRKKKFREKRATCYSQNIRDNRYCRSRKSHFEMSDDEELKEMSNNRTAKKSKHSDVQSDLADFQVGSGRSAKDSGENESSLFQDSPSSKHNVLKTHAEPSVQRVPRSSNPERKTSAQHLVTSQKTNQYVLGRDEIIFHKAFSSTCENDHDKMVGNDSNIVRNHQSHQLSPTCSNTSASPKLRSRRKRSQVEGYKKNQGVNPVQTCGIQRGEKAPTNPDEIVTQDEDMLDSDRASPEYVSLQKKDGVKSLCIENRTRRKRRRAISESSPEEETDEETVTKLSHRKRSKTAELERCRSTRSHTQRTLDHKPSNNISTQEQISKLSRSAQSLCATTRRLRKGLINEENEKVSAKFSKPGMQIQRSLTQKSITRKSNNSSCEDSDGDTPNRHQEDGGVKQSCDNFVENGNSAFVVGAASEEEASCSQNNKNNRNNDNVIGLQDRKNTRKRGQMDETDFSNVKKSQRWHKQEIERLHKALKTIRSDTDHYWEAVSHYVASRTAEECAAQCLQDIPNTKKASDKSLKASNAQKGGGFPVLQATKGTLKRKQELRAMLEYNSYNAVDDLFSSTPFKYLSKKKVPLVDFEKTDEEVFGKNPNFFTPRDLQKCKGGFSKTPASTRKTPSISGILSPLIEKSSSRRREADQYVFRMQKNRRRLAKAFPNQKSAESASQSALPGQSPAARLFHKTQSSDLFTITESNNSDEDEEKDYYYSDAD